MADNENTNSETSSEEPELIREENFEEFLIDIPKETIDSWKKYKNVFSIYFIDQQYVYRNFTYVEYKELRKKIRLEYGDNPEAGDDAFKEEIQKLCILWPTDYYERLNGDTENAAAIPGGIPFIMGDFILAASGFADSITPDVIPLK
jgi:hypothetical protein